MRSLIKVILISLTFCLAITVGARANVTPKTQAPAAKQPMKPAKPAVNAVTAVNLDNLVRYYSGQGHHRTGTKIDKRTTRWLSTLLKRQKYDVTVEKFAFTKPYTAKGEVVVERRPHYIVLKGIPLYNAKSTTYAGINGKLGQVGEKGVIPFFRLFVMMPTKRITPAFLKKNHQEFQKLLRSHEYKALLVVTEGGKSGLVPVDVDMNHKVSFPVLLVSANFGAYMDMKAIINQPIKLTAVVGHKRSEVRNIIAKLPGTDPALKPLVVLVQRNGWWRAASERGTGIAAWAAVAEQMKAESPKRTIYFVALGGSEYSKIGLKKFISSHPELTSNAYAWIYIGGNVATVPTPHYVIHATSARLGRLVKKVATSHGIKNIQTSTIEAKNDGSMPGTFISFTGTQNSCYHLICDKWPSAISNRALLKFTKTLYGLTKALADNT